MNELEIEDEGREGPHHWTLREEFVARGEGCLP